METVIFSLAVALLATGFLSRFLTRQWANPVFVLCVPHAALLLLYLVAVRENVFPQVSTATVALLAVGYGAYIGAYILLAPMLAGRVQRAELTPTELRTAYQMAKLALTLLSISVAGKYWILLGRYGSILENIVAIRLDYVSGELDYGAFNIVAFSSSWFLMLNLGALLGAGVRCRKLFHAAIALTVANDITVGGAYWTFLALSLLVCSWAVVRERRAPLRFKFTRAALLFALAGAALFSLLALRTEGRIGTDQDPVDVLVYYTAGDIASFDYFVKYPYPSNPPGRNTFGGLYGALDDFLSVLGVRVLDAPDSEDFIAEIETRFNTSVHFAHYFSDFGEYGVPVLSFVLALASLAGMIAYQRHYTLVRAQIYALLLFNVFASIRGVPTEGKHFWFMLVLIPLASALSRWVPGRVPPLAPTGLQAARPR